jgi:pimeloyl-ACP methyl ester carboxylesterase
LVSGDVYPRSEAALVASVVDRVASLPRSIGEKLPMDMVRYDGGRLSTALADLRVPVMVIQTTYSNKKSKRTSATKGQTTPYLDMLRTSIPSARIEIISDTGHFSQIDGASETNALLDSFIAMLLAD